MKAGTPVTLTIDRLSLGGEGVGRDGAMVVFVPYTVPGDQIEAEITEAKPRFARGRVLRVLQAGADRIRPPCPYHFRPELPPDALFCGGCSWQQLRYEGQLRAKQALVRESFERIAGLRDITVEPVLGMKDPWRYRNKVQQPVRWDGRRLVSGFFVPGSHDLMPIDECPVQPELSIRLINRTKELLDPYGVRAYDDRTHSGWLRHLWVRTTLEGKALLAFITRTPEFPHENEVLTSLIREFPALAGVHQNVNPSRTNVILGRRWRTLAGANFIEERLGKLRFRLSPGSFFQVNTLQAEVLYDVTRELAGRGERLLDIYCGVGGIALWLADRFLEVGAIEEVASAISDARTNARLNGITNVQFETASAEAFLGDLDRRAGGRAMTVIVDPPRSGCTPMVLKSLSMLHPGRIVYVSCDPGTLARDVKELVARGYQVQRVQPVDLFPQTPHIETVVQLDSR